MPRTRKGGLSACLRELRGRAARSRPSPQLLMLSWKEMLVGASTLWPSL